MAGEAGSSRARITRRKSKRAAKAAVSGGGVSLLTRRRHAPMGKSALRSCATKRKAAVSVRTRKRKATRIGCSELKQGAAAKGGEEEAPAKKKIRMPQEHVDRILSRSPVLDLPRHIKELKRWNPSLIPSPEEAMDEDTMELYDEARMFSDNAESYREFHASVRSEYNRYRYVLVDDDFLAEVEETRAELTEFKAELSQDMDDEFKRIVFKDLN